MGTCQKTFITECNISVNIAGIIIKKNDIPATEYAHHLSDWLGKKNITSQLNKITADMDIIITLGGDGTLLHIAEKASHLGIPVIGINLGNLGFLTELTQDEAKDALEKIISGPVIIENRLMLKGNLTGPDITESPRYALNDIVINKDSLDRILYLSTFADDNFITTYKADGLIFATPTGSTAYNLSTGGPLVYPGLSSILITPICPFMLGSRPILLDSDMKICTRLDKENSNHFANIIIDGKAAWKLKEGDSLTVQTATKPLRLIASTHRDYFTILSNKLHWGNQEKRLPPKV